ncbi:myoglobin-like [Protopterus annectens]|uniref:myoglobin-like n=1 Tax=Protopterus annectens TaxID=7888 RepID=UPI001CF98E0D|nr:myoglobin-like [Protopterus annectens]
MACPAKFWMENVVPDAAEHGKNILIRLYKEDPAALGFFPKYKDIPVSELGSNADVKEQGAVVVKALGELLKLKGQHESQLHAMAESHKNTYKIPVEYFPKIFKITDAYLQEKVGAAYAAIQAAMNVAFDQIADGLKTQYQTV